MPARANAVSSIRPSPVFAKALFLFISKTQKAKSSIYYQLGFGALVWVISF
jgi:hypothetical protein